MPYASKERAKEYNHQYFLKNWSKRKAKHKEWKSKRRASLAEWLRIYKEKLFCQNCKENHPATLDFHHIDSKTKDGTIANMVSEGYSTVSILKEINKCIILCKNCHAKEHFKTHTH